MSAVVDLPSQTAVIGPKWFATETEQMRRERQSAVAPEWPSEIGGVDA